MPNKADPDDSDAILLVERIQLPVSVPDWIFVEAGDVLKSSPFLGVVTGLLILTQLNTHMPNSVKSVIKYTQVHSS